MGSLNSGQTAIVTASVTVDAGTQPGTSLEFTGYAASDTADGNLVNNSDRADSSVIGSCGSDHLQDRHGNGQCR